MPYSLWVAIDHGPSTHNWYRAPSLDDETEGWILKIAQDLPLNMYIGRIGAESGRREWLCPGGLSTWVWSPLPLGTEIELHRPGRK